MRTFSAVFLILVLCLFLHCSLAETIVWEDESGQVILGDDGDLHFINADSAPDELPEPDPTPAPEPGFLHVPTLAPAGSLPESTAVQGNIPARTLRRGDSGTDVEALQQRLSELGFYHARVSGGYYDVTRRAVKDFQSHNGLAADGIAGQETLDLLFSSGARAASESPRPSPTPVPPRYKLMVDVTNQITRAYTYDESGEYTVLVREMICSTGTLRNPTPLGTTIMPKSRARWGYFPTWGSHAQYLTRIDKANAFHSVLYSSPNEQSLVISSFKDLGTRKSHGCVRLLVSDAQWIYENCTQGTIITVYESGVYDPEYTMTLKPTLNEQTQRENPLPYPTPEPFYSPQNWPTTYRTLSRGKSGTDVYMVQCRLKELGYYHGTVTGGYYGGTIEAVRAFQQANGLKADGVCGRQTQQKLFADAQSLVADYLSFAAMSPTPLPEVTLTPEPSATPTPLPTATPEPAMFQPVEATVG